MSNEIYLIGEVGYEITLERVIDMVKNTNQKEDLNVFIHSVGGDVYEGIAIYNYFKSLPQKVNTSSVSLVASIASVFYLAGEKETRAINSSDNFLIHLPWCMAGGNARDFEHSAKELRRIENILSNIYANETNLTKHEALELMEKDEFLDIEFLKDKGFVSVIKENKAVAKLGQKKEVNKMNDKKETFSKEEKSFIKKILNELGIGGTKKEQPKNIIVKTASQDELNFPRVEEGAEPQVGDEANINGEKPNGEYVINERLTYVFENGVLTEIKEETEEENETEELTIEDKVKALEAENESLKEQLSAKTTIENSLTEKETQFKNLETKYNELNDIYTTMINKLESFSSQEVVETKQEQKKEVNNKNTANWNERIANLKNKGKK